MQPAPSCLLCRTVAHLLLFLCNLLRDGKQVQRFIEACANTNSRNSFYTGGGGAPSSSLDVSAFSSVLCQDDPTVFVPRLGDAHPWRTDFLSVFLSLCFYCTGSVTCDLWPVAGVYQMFLGLTLRPLSSSRWGHTVLRSAMFSALFESTCWCKNSILCQTVFSLAFFTDSATEMETTGLFFPTGYW